MKKKKYVYFFVPLVALIFFVAYYWNFRQGYEHAQEEKAAVIQRAKEAEIKEQNRLREKAVEDSLAAQDKRRKEKAAKDATRLKMTEDRQNALQARDKAQADAQKAKERAERLTRDVELVKDEIKKTEQDEKVLRTEEASLQELVKQAQANVSELTQVLDRITAVDEAIAANAARAAEEARKKNS